MVEILEHLHQYVPTVSTTESVSVPQHPTPLQVSVDKFHHLELGTVYVNKYNPINHSMGLCRRRSADFCQGQEQPEDPK